MTDEQKRWLVSSFNTFVTGFVVTFYQSIDSITLENFYTSITASIIFTAARAGVKALMEARINKTKNKNYEI